jgi:hypothetical protein
MMEMELKENDLISFMNPMCPQCLSRKVVRNGTYLRTMETGIVFRVQRYTCRDCKYSFAARPPNYGYGSITLMISGRRASGQGLRHP